MQYIFIAVIRKLNKVIAYLKYWRMRHDEFLFNTVTNDKFFLIKLLCTGFINRSLKKIQVKL